MLLPALASFDFHEGICIYLDQGLRLSKINKKQNKQTLATVQEFAPCCVLIPSGQPVLFGMKCIRNRYACVLMVAPIISIYI